MKLGLLVCGCVTLLNTNICTGGPLMDLAYLEANCGKDSLVLVKVFEECLGITVSKETSFRFCLLTKKRKNLNKKKRKQSFKKRRKVLKHEAMRWHGQRTKQAATNKKLTYKAPSNEVLVRLGGV